MKFQEKHIAESVRKAIKKILKEATRQQQQQQNLIVPNIEWMSVVFNKYNQFLFGGKLTTPKFSLKCDPDEWGCYYPSAGNNGQYNRFTMKGQGTLCLNGAYKRTQNQWIATMLHEMCHEYVYQNGVSKFTNQHDDKFWRIANYVNEKMRPYGIEIKENVDGGDVGVVKSDGNEEYAVYRDENGNPVYGQGVSSVLCVIDNPNGNGYSCWICLLKENEIQQAKSILQNFSKKIKGLKYNFYYVQSQKLANANTDPSNLAGFGGNSYNDAVKKLRAYYGEWNPENFNSNNLRPIK